MKKMVILMVLFTLSFSSYAEAIPADAVTIATQSVAKTLNLSEQKVRQNFLINWEYIFTREDDQLIVVRFNGPQYCTVEVGSVSLQVFSSVCKHLITQ